MELLNSKFNVDEYLAKLSELQKSSASALSFPPEVSLSQQREDAFENYHLTNYQEINVINAFNEWRFQTSLLRRHDNYLKRRAYLAIREKRSDLHIISTEISKRIGKLIVREAYYAMKKQYNAGAIEKHRLQLYFVAWRINYRKRFKLNCFVECKLEELEGNAFYAIVDRYNVYERLEYEICSNHSKEMEFCVLRIMKQQYKVLLTFRRVKEAIVKHFFCLMCEEYELLNKELAIRKKVELVLKKYSFSNMRHCYLEVCFSRESCHSLKRRIFVALYEIMISKEYFDCFLLRLSYINWKNLSCYRWLNCVVGEQFTATMRLKIAFFSIEKRAREVLEAEIELNCAMNEQHVAAAFKIIRRRYRLLAEMPFKEPYEKIASSTLLILSRKAFDAWKQQFKDRLLLQLKAIRFSWHYLERCVFSILLECHIEYLKDYRQSLRHNIVYINRMAFYSIKEQYLQWKLREFKIDEKYNMLVEKQRFTELCEMHERLNAINSEFQSHCNQELQKFVLLEFYVHLQEIVDNQKKAIIFNNFEMETKSLLELLGAESVISRFKALEAKNFAKYLLRLLRYRHYESLIANHELKSKETRLLCNAFGALSHSTKNQVLKSKLFALWRRCARKEEVIGYAEMEKLVRRKLEEYPLK